MIGSPPFKRRSPGPPSSFAKCHRTSKPCRKLSPIPGPRGSIATVPSMARTTITRAVAEGSDDTERSGDTAFRGAACFPKRRGAPLPAALQIPWRRREPLCVHPGPSVFFRCMGRVEPPISDTVSYSRKSPSDPRQHDKSPPSAQRDFRHPSVIRGQSHDATGPVNREAYENERARKKTTSRSQTPDGRHPAPDKRRLAQALESGLSQHPAARQSPKSKV